MAIVSRTVDNGSGTDIDVAVDARGGTTDDVQVIGLIRSDADTLVTATADGVLVNLGTNNDVTVTGTVTANAGTNLNTSALALESGGNLAAIATDAAAIEALLITIDADTSTLAAAVSTEMQVDVVGALPAGTNNIGITTDAKAGTAAAKSLNSGTSSAEFCAANTDRIWLTMTNTDANRCYVNVGAAASATAFVVFLDEGDYYELPKGITGAVNAIWAGDGSGALIGQEFD